MLGVQRDRRGESDPACTRLSENCHTLVLIAGIANPVRVISDVTVTGGPGLVIGKTRPKVAKLI
jgi:hypothetical protein